MKTVCPSCRRIPIRFTANERHFPPILIQNILYQKPARSAIPPLRKKEKSTRFSRVLAPSQTPRTQSVRYFRPNLPSARRADRPAAAGRIKFPIKVQLCRTFIPLPRDTCPEPPLPCRGEGVIAPGFSGTGGVSKGDSVPLRRRRPQPSHTSSCSPLRGRASSSLMPSFADRPPYSTPYIASVIGMETPCCCARW